MEFVCDIRMVSVARVLGDTEMEEAKNRRMRLWGGMPVDKKRLQKVPKLKREIEFLQKQLRDAEYYVEQRRVSDSVRGSSKHFPYLQKTFSVSGIDVPGYERRVKRYRAQLQKQIDAYMDTIAEAQEYIAAVEDSRTRMVLQCRYINGLTWEQTEDETGIPERTARWLHERWWKGQKKDLPI